MNPARSAAFRIAPAWQHQRNERVVTGRAKLAAMGADVCSCWSATSSGRAAAQSHSSSPAGKACAADVFLQPSYGCMILFGRITQKLTPFQYLVTAVGGWCFKKFSKNKNQGSLMGCTAPVGASPVDGHRVTPLWHEDEMTACTARNLYETAQGECCISYKGLKIHLAVTHRLQHINNTRAQSL
jgi:hypothetical protein